MATLPGWIVIAAPLYATVGVVQSVSGADWAVWTACAAIGGTPTELFSSSLHEEVRRSRHELLAF
jgi:hypothetical protein